MADDKYILRFENGRVEAIARPAVLMTGALIERYDGPVEITGVSQKFYLTPDQKDGYWVVSIRVRKAQT